MKIPWLVLVLTFSSGGAKAESPVSVQGVSWEKEARAYLVLAVTNEPGWHTYYKDPGEVGLPFRFSFSSAGKPVPLDLVGWPKPASFQSAVGVAAKGYTGQYAFFFLPVEPAKEGDQGEFHVKWLSCGAVCKPQEVKVAFRYEGTRWRPQREEDRGLTGRMEGFFSQLEPNTGSRLGEPLQVAPKSWFSFFGGWGKK